MSRSIARSGLIHPYPSAFILSYDVAPNGLAAACKAECSGFDSRRRLFEWKVDIGVVRPAARGTPGNRIGTVCTVIGLSSGGINAVSSEAEHQTHNLAVAGSIPVPTTKWLLVTSGRDRKVLTARCRRREDFV